MNIMLLNYISTFKSVRIYAYIIMMQSPLAIYAWGKISFETSNIYDLDVIGKKTPRS